MGGKWFPKFIASSTGSAGKVTQYCRKGAREDPWISVGHHPDKIVYGEAGYGGHNKDDAMNFGGANVWVNSITKSNFDVKNGYAHMKFQGKDWYLVRRKMGPKGGWHKVNDQAQGTKAYGSNCKNPRGNCDFSTKYSNIKWSNMLMASGDLKMWVTLPKSTVTSFNKINCRNCVLKLTGSSGSKSARQYMRQGAREDPWISAGNHPSHIVYGENGYNGHNSDDALNFGGANVWVDNYQ